jgi:Dynamin family
MTESADSAHATQGPLEPAPESGEAGGKRQLPRRIVVVGEFNSGKTSLVNVLLGEPVLSASFIVRTAYPTVVGFAARPSLSAEIANRRRIRLGWDRLDQAAPEGTRRLHVGMPLERLRRLRVIDTPGLGFGDESRDKLTLRICSRADTVIWCTPATQAWKASEERAWLTVPKRVRDHGILAVTFEDAIASLTDVGRLLARLRAEAGCHFGSIVLASERGALVPSLAGGEGEQKRETGAVEAMSLSEAAELLR